MLPSVPLWPVTCALRAFIHENIVSLPLLDHLSVVISLGRTDHVNLFPFLSLFSFRGDVQRKHEKEF